MSKSKEPRYHLLGTTPFEIDKTLTGSRLPICRQVLLCFLAHHDTLTKRESAKETVKSVLTFYERARVPHLFPNKMEDEVIKLFDSMNTLLKYNFKERSQENYQTKVKEFKAKLDSTMKFWPRNVFQKITNEEDRAFLHSMMTDRIATMGSVDQALSTTEKKVRLRKEQEEYRISRETVRKLGESSKIMDTEDDNAEINVAEEDSVVYKPDPSHKRKLKTGTVGFWPCDILKSPEVVQTAMRNHISPTVLTALTKSYIKATGGDPSKITLSYSTAYRLELDNNCKSPNMCSISFFFRMVLWSIGII